jgi:hypothetical protein
MTTKKQTQKKQDLKEANKNLFNALINKASKPLPLKKKTKA